MSDSDDYDESSDEDYVPKAEEVSEEEESGEDEDFDPAADDDGSAANGAGSASTKKGKRKKRGEIIKRERKGGIKLEGEAEDDDVEDEEERKEKEEKDKIINKEVEKEMELMKEKEETKKIDDLWSSFLSDVKQKPKSAMSSKSSACSSTSSPAGSLASLSKPVSSSPSSSSTKPTSSASTEKKPEKVTITKIFDFAGEEVRVTKEVAADSKEAKAATKEQTSEDEKESPAVSSPGPGVSGVKRPAGGLGSVLGKIGKKAKISVLNSSKDKETVGNLEDLGANTACDQMGNLQSENQMDVIANSNKSLKKLSTASLIVAEQNSECRDEPIQQLGRFSCRSNCEGMCVCFMPRKSRVLPSPPRHDDPLDKFLKDRDNDWESDEEPSLQIRSILNLT